MPAATVRDVVYRRAVVAMAVAWGGLTATLVVGTIAIDRHSGALGWTAFGLYVVAFVAMLWRIRCPACRFGMPAQRGWRLRRGDARWRLNFCPHCGADFDSPPARRRERGGVEP